MSIADKLTLVAKNQEKVYKAGQNSMVDPEKLIPKTATGKLVSLNDVSEIPHKISVKTSPDTTVTVCGKNIFDWKQSVRSYGAMALSENDDGTFNLRGTLSTINYSYLCPYIAQSIFIPKGTQISIAGYYESNVVGTRLGIVFCDEDKKLISQRNNISNGSNQTVILEHDVYHLGFCWACPENTQGDYVEFNNIKIQVEVYPIVTDYEQYKAIQYTADADGNIGNIKSLSPYINIYNSSGLEMSVDYNKSYVIQTEYDNFWDSIQKKGNRRSYPYAFTYDGWNDATYNPKYDIVATSANYLFYYSTITDTKVSVDLSKITTNVSNVFTNCLQLVRIKKLIVGEETGYNAVFNNCSKLTDIEFEGTIGKSISFAQSPLNIESLKNIILHLKDCSGGSTETHILTLKDECKTLLEENGNTSPNGNLWTEYISDLGWVLA